MEVFYNQFNLIQLTKNHHRKLWMIFVITYAYKLIGVETG